MMDPGGGGNRPGVMADWLGVDVEERICSNEECGRGGKLSRGMCARCYRFWLDHTPKEQRRVAPRFVDDFWDQVDKTHEFGCWVWRGPTIGRGYGRWKNRHLAHRESWKRANGPIPAGLWILHHCDNPPCVNPAHLYPGTRVENTRDAKTRNRFNNPRKSHCPQGHLKDGDNLIIVRDKGGHAYRCRKCDNERKAAAQRAARRARGLWWTKLSAEEEARIRELRVAGTSHRAIAKIVGRSQMAVDRVIKDAGL